MVQDTIFYQKIKRIFDRNSSPLVMGILNVTPDSFFDGGKFTTEEAWMEQTRQMINLGVDLVDIGAYSTRPGAKDISEQEELDRVLPAILSIRKEFPDLLISVDTFRANVAEKSIEAGGHIINDISGGTFDPNMFSTVSKWKVPYVLMHIQGTPQTMQLDPQYADVVNEVFSFFEERLNELKKAGVDRVILDPGFGFGKTVQHNFQLLKHLEKFKQLGCPILAGLSRKSMVNKLLDISNKDSLNGTSILNSYALQNGGNILRVHDVKEAKEVIRIYEYIKSI